MGMFLPAADYCTNTAMKDMVFRLSPTSYYCRDFQWCPNGFQRSSKSSVVQLWYKLLKPVLQGRSRDTMLQSVSPPLRPGGRQPYNGCPFGGTGLLALPCSSFLFSSHVVVVLKLTGVGSHCGLVFLLLAYILVNHTMDLYFSLVQQLVCFLHTCTQSRNCMFLHFTHDIHWHVLAL